MSAQPPQRRRPAPGPAPKRAFDRLVDDGDDEPYDDPYDKPASVDLPYDDQSYDDDQPYEDAPARGRRVPRQRRPRPELDLARRWATTRSRASTVWDRAVAHWSRAPYIYLAVVGVAIVLSMLLYWHDGFAYDDCRSCGLPTLAVTSPWWLLNLLIDTSGWPGLTPLLIPIAGALVNAELLDRYVKSPDSRYPGEG